MCASCGNMIDRHQCASCTNPLPNPNNLQSPIVNPTISHFHPTSPLDFTANPRLFFTPTNPGHILIINRLTHQEVSLRTSTNKNNNDLVREFRHSIKKAPPHHAIL